MLRFAPLLLAGGCSFVFVKGPAADPPPRCTSSPWLPLLDSAGAAAAFTLATSAALFVARHEYDNSPGDQLQRDFDRNVAIGLAVTGLIYSGSAGFGFYRMQACRHAAPMTTMPAPTPAS